MSYLQDDATASSGLEGKKFFRRGWEVLGVGLVGLPYNRAMTEWSISEIGRKAGLRASAIRYYEQIGILKRAPRISGQRRYDESALYRLTVVRRAQDAGFTLDEVRELFFGFSESTPVSERWKKMAKRKMAELDARIEEIQSMRELLGDLRSRCECETVERCGRECLG